MDHLHSTISPHKKGKHLCYDERMLIQIRLKDGRSIRAIAREIGCSPSTVSNEIKRGTVLMYKNHSPHYRASAGQKAYEENRKACCRHYDLLMKEEFFDYVSTHFFDNSWSLDACANRALLDGGFSRQQTVSTKTLYNYIDLGLLDIKNHNLPEKLKRCSKVKRQRINKKKLGRSIEERPKDIETRREFGHWECDLVLGSKTKDDKAILTLAERKSREFLMIPLECKNSENVMKAMKDLKALYSEHFNEVFKTLTTDNGSEFADLSRLEEISSTLVYYAHPYTSCDKATVERHNGLIRRFIPKGKRIRDLSIQQIADVETWCNSLPRKLLGYKTPDEIFEDELDRIYKTNVS